MNNWLISNKLSLNVDKSCYLNFSLLHTKTDVNIRIANKALELKRVTKYLGVLIDDKLLWKDHIQSINMKLRKGIGILYNLKEYVTKSTLRSLYFSFIYPYLDYNLINWSSTPISNLNSLKLSNKKAVRTILSKNKREPSLPLFKELNILPLDKLIDKKRASYIWKIKNNLLQTIFTVQFTINQSEIVNRINEDLINTSIPVLYQLPQPRIEYTKRHYLHWGQTMELRNSK